MRHETFHDTTNLKKRKPNRLRGTPANKYSHAISFGCVFGFTLACHYLTTAGWMQPALERFAENTAPLLYQEQQKWMINDVLTNSIIRNKQLREEGIKPEDGSVYSSANY